MVENSNDPALTEFVNQEVDPYPDLTAWIQELNIPGINTLHDAAERVQATQERLNTRELRRRSGQVVMGTLLPDRFLPEPDRTLHHIVLRSVRRRFKVGELPMSRNVG